MLEIIKEKTKHEPALVVNVISYMYQRFFRAGAGLGITTSPRVTVFGWIAWRRRHLIVIGLAFLKERSMDGVYVD